MAYEDLREFVKVLEKHGELKRISVEVDPILEITEFADRSLGASWRAPGPTWHRQVAPASSLRVFHPDDGATPRQRSPVEAAAGLSVNLAR